MARRCAVVLVTALALALSLIAAIPAGAHTKAVSDANDTNGPLDIGRITATHTDTTITHTIQMRSRWSPRVLRRDNVIVGWFSTDADSRDAERLLYIFHRSGRLRGVVANRKGQALFSVRITRPNARTVKWSFGSKQLTSGGRYRWGAFSYYKAAGRCKAFCVDRAPQHSPMPWDYTVPVVDILTEAPNGLTTDLSSDPALIELEFVAMDKGNFGTRTWKIQRRPVGGSTWTTLDSGLTTTNMSPQASTVSAPQQGVTYDFRLVATDGPHTSSTTIRLVSPKDDAATGVVEGFSGEWSSGSDAVQMYLGTWHYTTTDGATFTHAFSGSELWLIGEGGPVEVVVDGGEPVSVDPIGTRSVFFHQTLGPGDHTVVLTTTSTSQVILDAVATR